MQSVLLAPSLEVEVQPQAMRAEGGVVAVHTIEELITEGGEEEVGITAAPFVADTAMTSVMTCTTPGESSDET